MSAADQTITNEGAGSMSTEPMIVGQMSGVGTIWTIALRPERPREFQVSVGSGPSRRDVETLDSWSDAAVYAAQQVEDEITAEEGTQARVLLSLSQDEAAMISDALHEQAGSESSLRRVDRLVAMSDRIEAELDARRSVR